MYLEEPWALQHTLPRRGMGPWSGPYQGSQHVGGLPPPLSPSWELVTLPGLPGMAAEASQRLSTADLPPLWPFLFVLCDFSHFFSPPSL